MVTTVPREPALPDLDEGEAASIRLALASSPQVLLLIDERAGRVVARELGLKLARRWFRRCWSGMANETPRR